MKSIKDNKRFGKSSTYLPLAPEWHDTLGSRSAATPASLTPHTSSMRENEVLGQPRYLRGNLRRSRQPCALPDYNHISITYDIAPAQP